MAISGYVYILTLWCVFLVGGESCGKYRTLNLKVCYYGGITWVLLHADNYVDALFLYNVVIATIIMASSLLYT